MLTLPLSCLPFVLAIHAKDKLTRSKQEEHVNEILFVALVGDWHSFTDSISPHNTRAYWKELLRPNLKVPIPSNAAGAAYKIMVASIRLPHEPISLDGKSREASKLLFLPKEVHRRKENLKYTTPA